MKNYSQNTEQDIILKYFGTFVGRFLDIGAYNGLDISNTRALLERGWSGVLVEPNPFNTVELINNCRPFADQVTIYCAGAGAMGICSRLRLDETPGRGWAASFVVDNPGILKPSPMRVMVPILPVWEFFGGSRFDLISIDAEWMDDLILHGFARAELEACRMLIVEPAGGLTGRVATREYLLGLGFVIYAETPENILAAKPVAPPPSSQP